MEEWKAVPGYEGSYEVSNEGRVRSLDRTVPHSRHGTIRVKGQEIAARVDSYGYQIVNVWRGGEMKARKVHQLVLEAFVGPRPEGHVTLHADDDTKNNRLGNLSYGTPAENSRQMSERGRWAGGAREATHCRNGHEYTAKSSRIRSDGYRSCLSCRDERKRKGQR